MNNLYAILIVVIFLFLLTYSNLDNSPKHKKSSAFPFFLKIFLLGCSSREINKFLIEEKSRLEFLDM